MAADDCNSGNEAVAPGNLLETLNNTVKLRLKHLNLFQLLQLDVRALPWIIKHQDFDPKRPVENQKLALVVLLVGIALLELEDALVHRVHLLDHDLLIGLVLF